MDREVAQAMWGWWGAGSSENKANSSQLVLELGQSLAKLIFEAIFKYELHGLKCPKTKNQLRVVL